MLLSSFLSNVSVISIAYGRNYTHTHRPQWILNYIDREGLREDDIVVVFDGGDTLFTGAQRVQQALTHFMATTAPTAEAFDAAAVHRGEASAPILFSSESFCYAPQLELVIRKGPKPHYRKCLWFYTRMWKAAAITQNRRLSQQKKKEYRFLTSGGYVGRVWALRAATLAYTRLLETRSDWWCDQSIWTLLYIWSVSQVPGVPTEQRIPFGFIDLDYNKIFFISPSKGAFTNSAIFHFPGPMDGWQPFLPKIINHTLWIKEIYYSPQSLRSVRCRVLSEAFVKVQDAYGYTHAYRYGNLCPAKDALKLSWLASAFPK
ncbi:expression site-associated gene (ESAG-like) protein [Trypanosoma theileri]|uniref:Expression site-associated gene (ESAG-like) protein n=1 Tax=Trypanosoma theileri TaxID=67003 RepID=A0A1X0P024_9TRYP|nr:expression site-associated gene (ESAG-like) protein [Trypanosoma theileri]ORC90296.1 expression site-associated gene (ESAG-like) protein [Trypanosoma theileri]